MATITIQEYLDQEYPLNGACQGNFDQQNKGKTREEIELDEGVGSSVQHTPTD